MEKILPVFLYLNFTPNILGCHGFKIVVDVFEIFSSEEKICQAGLSQLSVSKRYGLLASALANRVMN